MVETLLHGHPLELFPFLSPERSSGGRQEDPLQILVGIALEGLKNGTVFTVHWSQLDPRLFHCVHHQTAGRHQGLLVGQCNVLPCPDGRQGRFQTCIAHHGSQHRIRLAAGSCGHDAFRTAEDLRGALIPAAQPLGSLRIGESCHRRMEFPDLGFQQHIILVSSQRRHLEPFRIGLYHIQGLGADGSCRSQDCDFFHTNLLQPKRTRVMK